MKPKLVLIGGFLGSGKTTLLLRLGEALTNEHGKRVVMITNDQGEVLVDSVIAKDYGFETAEIIRGCFCCNFQIFIKHAQKILEELRPDVILAEPVGSCSGLMPTLYRPIQEFYSGEFKLAPLIIMVDASRLLKLHQEINLLDAGDPIAYLIASQIKEGEIMCINKVDLVDDSTIMDTLSLLRRMRPEAEFVLTSAKFNVGVDKVVDVILKGVSRRLPYPDVDMIKYTEAELELAWFDGLYEVKSEGSFNPMDFIKEVLEDVVGQIASHNGFIAHVKAYLRTPNRAFKASVTSTDSNVDIGGPESVEHTNSGVLLVNARVKLSPEKLSEIVNIALEKKALKYNVTLPKIRAEAYRPKPPKPQFYIPYSRG
ncbi:hypothetical protein KEJ27_05270 [Candidatus Bathyarchaeota archaeon]|nr:hypothetical protein [Candidatus Bathyarchaeota archaeon]